MDVFIGPKRTIVTTPNCAGPRPCRAARESRQISWRTAQRTKYYTEAEPRCNFHNAPAKYRASVPPLRILANAGLLKIAFWHEYWTLKGTSSRRLHRPGPCHPPFIVDKRIFTRKSVGQSFSFTNSMRNLGIETTKTDSGENRLKSSNQSNGLTPSKLFDRNNILQQNVVRTNFLYMNTIWKSTGDMLSCSLRKCHEEVSQ